MSRFLYTLVTNQSVDFPTEAYYLSNKDTNFCACIPVYVCVCVRYHGHDREMDLMDAIDEALPLIAAPESVFGIESGVEQKTIGELIG